MANLSTVDFGSDLSGVTDLTLDCAEVSGARGWLEGLCRRLQVPPGGLLDDPDYGYDVADWLDDEIKQSQLDSIARDIDDEFLKDQRTESSSSVVTIVKNGGAISLNIVSRVSSAAGPFTLVIGASDLGVQLLSVTP